MLEQWNLLETLTLTRATYTHVWARNAEGGETEQKIFVEAITGRDSDFRSRLYRIPHDLFSISDFLTFETL